MFISIKDGGRSPISFNTTEVVAYRDAGNGFTWIFIRGESDGWKVECSIEEVSDALTETN